MKVQLSVAVLTLIGLACGDDTAPLGSDVRDAMADDDSDTVQPTDGMDVEHTGNDADDHDTAQGGEGRGDGADAQDADQTTAVSDCEAEPIPEGDLQNQASGSSVFGRAVGGPVREFDALGGTGCGEPGVVVCLRGTDTCTETDAAGQFVLLDLPDDSNVEITFEKPEYRSILRLVQTSGAPVNLIRVRMSKTVELQALVEAAGVTPQPELGSVMLVPLAPGEAVGAVSIPEGVEFTLAPGDHTPLYTEGIVEEGGFPKDALDPELTATRFGGSGMFLNVEPGDYVVRFERNGTVCNQLLPGYAFGLDDEGQANVRILGGMTTLVALLCL